MENINAKGKRSTVEQNLSRTSDVIIHYFWVESGLVSSGEK